MDEMQHMPSYPSFLTRYREPDRYKDRTRYPGYKPANFPPYQQFEFEGYKPGFQPDYKSYKDMMDDYNRKQEEEFRRQLEKAKMQMHYMPQGQEMYQYAESQERPIWNAPQESGMIKGDWSPMSNSESTYHASSYPNPVYETPATTSQAPPHIDYAKLDMTTSKPYRLPPITTAKNLTLNSGKQKINYNFSPNYFPNHKAEIYKENENEVKEATDKEKVTDFQPSSVVSTSYSTLWGNEQNESENNGNKFQSTSGAYGTKTKVRRTKRPAYTPH